MTVETEVANLTTAVDNLTASVNVAKGTLDAKVSDAQTAEANAASHEVTILGYKNAAETAAASAVSVVQQDLSALGFDVPHGAVAICPIDPYEHGDARWVETGKQSWRSEARASGKYLGTQSSTANAWAITGAAAGDYYWNSTTHNIYELTGTSTASLIFRAGKSWFDVRWAVAFSNGDACLLQEDGAPFMMFDRYWPGTWADDVNVIGLDVTDLSFVGSRLLIGQSNGTVGALVIVDFAADTITAYRTTDAGLYNGNIAQRNDTLGFADTLSGRVVANTVNAVAATVLPNAPIVNGVPVPTIAVATDGGLSFIHNDGTVTSRAETEANMETTDVEFIGNSGAYRYQHRWSAGHDARVVYAPAEHLKDTSVLAYNTNLYQSWETPVVGFNKTTYHTTLRQISNRTDPNGTSRVIAGDSMGGDQGITRVWHNEANPPASMVAYQADDHTTPPMFGDVKGAFLCEQGQAGVLVGANLRTDPFDVVTDWAKIGADGHTLTAVSGEGHLTKDGSVSADNHFEITVACTVGDLIKVQAEGWRVSGTGAARIGIYDNGGSLKGASEYATTGTHKALVAEHVATSNPMRIRLVCGGGANAGVAGFDNLTVDIAHPDRSVNGKGLIINGSLTQDADGWVSGFSATDYLEQPYNADLDLTGDFYAFVAVNAIGNGYLFARGEQGVNQPIHLRLFNGTLRAAAGGAVDADVDFPSGSEGLVGLVLRGTTLEVWQLGSLVGTGAGTPNSSGVEDIFRIGIKTGGEANALTVGSIRRVVIGAGAPSHAQIKVMSDWVGDRLEGAFKDMHFEPSTKVLHVLTDAYHYEVDADGAVLKSTPNTSTWLKVTASRDGVVRTS